MAWVHNAENIVLVVTAEVFLVIPSVDVVALLVAHTHGHTGAHAAILGHELLLLVVRLHLLLLHVRVNRVALLLGEANLRVWIHGLAVERGQAHGN